MVDVDAECSYVVNSHGNYVMLTAADRSDYVILQEVVKFVRLDKFEK